MRRQREERAGQYRRPTYRDLQARLAANVRRIRTRKGLTQEEAAFRCDMATQVLQRVEAGTVNITFTTLARLSDGLEVDPRDLLKVKVKVARARQPSTNASRRGGPARASAARPRRK